MNSAITVGNYDGLHIAHKKIISRLKEYSERNNLTPVVFTFSNHPKEFFTKKIVKKILTNTEKRKLLENLGVNVVFQKFDLEFSNLTADQFIRALQQKYGLKALFTGDDHRFGKDRKCDYLCMKALSQKLNFEVFNIDAVYVDNERVSSSAIRKHITNGCIDIANKMLGYDFFLTGKVVDGNKLGRQIGFPTANLSIPTDKIIPAKGVYAAYTFIDGKKYPAMVNIGYKPTVSNETNLFIEAHIINFDKNIYDREITISFLQKLRDEQQFSNISELIKQLEMDKKMTIEINKIIGINTVII